ncbi:MAG TPA: hypothetical protein VKK79_18715, partial [Candidatus Lokiarchaeia archaeon]|nr:hypothetical protein [Candidatus Lokiarchaeia archaeon]
MASKLNDNSEAMKRQQAEEAMALIEEADKLESEEEFAKAAYTYQKAAERLQRSGYASDHLEEIYTKITVLNNRISLAKKTGRLEERQHTAELQQQAFAIMDEANKLKAGGKYQDAIVQYTSAAGMLTEAGWSPVQLEGIQSEVTKLQQLMVTASRPKVTALAQYISQPETEQAPSEVPDLREIQAKRAETLQSFEDRRKADEEVQQAAFWAIDEGKAHVAKKNYDAAITAYQYAIEQLNSIGWTDQTKLLLQEVQNLTRLREMPEQAPARGAREPSPAVATFEMLQGTEVSAESTAAASVQAVARFEERRQQAQEQINQAFALIDEADGQVQQEEWDLAINNYNSAINLFNKSGWQGQTSNLYAVVARLREEKTKTEQAAALASVPTGAEEISSADSYVSAGFEAQSADLAAQLEAGFAARRE